MSDATVWTWGRDLNALGIGNEAPPAAGAGIHVDDIAPVRHIAAGDGFAVAVLDDGTIIRWGSNARGQTGLGHVDTATPLPGMPNLLGTTP